MKEKCCLCGKTIEGYAHNAQPLADGKCCEECNIKIVEARLEEFARFLAYERISYRKVTEELIRSLVRAVFCFEYYF